jgi:hypothetical protein
MRPLTRAVPTTWPGAAITGRCARHVPYCRCRSVLCLPPWAHSSAREGRRRRVYMALALRLADAFAVHRTADGTTVPAPGPHPWQRFPPLGPRQPSWPFFSAYATIRPPGFLPWPRFRSSGPRRTRGPLSVACGAAEHAEVQPVGRMMAAIRAAEPRHSAASQLCAAARCRT